MPVSVGSYSSPTCWQKVKAGVLTGFCIGVVTGCIFGGVSSYKYGLRGKELMSNMGKLILQGGSTFSTFMGIGSMIRC